MMVAADTRGTFDASDAPRAVRSALAEFLDAHHRRGCRESRAAQLHDRICHTRDRNRRRCADLLSPPGHPGCAGRWERASARDSNDTPRGSMAISLWAILATRYYLVDHRAVVGRTEVGDERGGEARRASRPRPGPQLSSTAPGPLARTR